MTKTIIFVCALCEAEIRPERWNAHREAHRANTPPVEGEGACIHGYAKVRCLRCAVERIAPRDAQ